MSSLYVVVVARQYYEPYDVDPRVAVEAGLAMLLGRKIPRQTEGMLHNGQFPINYFSVSALEQWFDDEYADCFERMTGKRLRYDDDKYFRFNRTFDFGEYREPLILAE